MKQSPERKSQTMELYEDDIGENLHYIQSHIDFFSVAPKAQTTTDKTVWSTSK